MFVVGKGSKLEYNEKRVIAYVTSEKRAVGYLMSRGVGEYWKLTIESNLNLIDFEEPFSDVGDSGHFSTVHKKIRTLVLLSCQRTHPRDQVFHRLPPGVQMDMSPYSQCGKKPEPQVARKGVSHVQSYIFSNGSGTGEEEGSEISIDVATLNDENRNTTAIAEQTPNIKRKRDSDELEDKDDRMLSHFSIRFSK
jgi:hypothetical protein